MSTRITLPAALLAATMLLSACAATTSGTPRLADVAPTPAPTADSSLSPSLAPSAPAGGLAHPTGANEIILRADESGGFVPVEWSVAHVPYFTLYGDGRVVFVSASTVVEPTPDGVITSSPLRTGILPESRIQDLLLFALSDGGLAAARTDYPNPLVADVPSTIFEIHADGDSKTVSIMALGMDGEPGPDTAIKAAFVKLAALLRDFDKGGALGSVPYAPTAYRAVLNDATGAEGVRVRDWPWPGLKTSDFKLPADPNTLQLRTRVLTPTEAEAIGVKGFEAGIVGGVYVKSPDGKLFSLALRPLLPDEVE